MKKKNLIQIISIRKDSEINKLLMPHVRKYAERTGAELRVNTEFPTDLDYDIPNNHPKFLIYHNIKTFVESDFEKCLFLDDDIFVSQAAQNIFDLVSRDEIALSSSELLGGRKFENFLLNFTQEPSLLRSGFCFNSGVVVMGKTGASAFLEQAKPPYQTGCIEQDQFNYFVLKTEEHLRRIENTEFIHGRPKWECQFTHFNIPNRVRAIREFLEKLG